jgi:hypothetical protein
MPASPLLLQCISILAQNRNRLHVSTLIASSHKIIIKYRDVYEKLHETRFGYYYETQVRHLAMKDKDNPRLACVLDEAHPWTPILNLSGFDSCQLHCCDQPSHYCHHPYRLVCCLILQQRLPWRTRITSHDGCPKDTSVETMYERRSMHIGQDTVTEPVTASTEIGMHRLHPLQRTTCT